MLSPANQDRLEQEGGACIMYTHFGHGFVEDQKARFPFFRVDEALEPEKNGWYVPVSTLLDHLARRRGPVQIGAHERNRLQNRWFVAKALSRDFLERLKQTSERESPA